MNARSLPDLMLHLIFALMGFPLAGIAACSGNEFTSCASTKTCPPSANAGGLAGGGQTGSGGSVQAGAGGNATSDGGTAGADTAGTGGSAGEATSSFACASTYHDWLVASFSVPDGQVVGAADFPSMPWHRSGTISVASGRITGTGSLRVLQGVALPYSGLRLRARGRFSDSKQHVSFGMNAANDGGGALMLTVDAAGKLRIAEGTQTRQEEAFAALEFESDWFLEAIIDSGTASVVLSSKNYASESGATRLGTLETHSLERSAGGMNALIALAGSAATVDELAISRCGTASPSYAPVFVDTFERPDSTTLGNAELPATSTWTRDSDATVISSGALQLAPLKSASIPQGDYVSPIGARLRVAYTTPPATKAPWIELKFNAKTPDAGIGFDFWWDLSNPPRTYIRGVGTSESFESPNFVTASTQYYFELNTDDSMAVFTTRTGSFTGPIVVVHAAEIATGSPVTNPIVAVDSDSPAAQRLEELRLDRYAPQ